LCFLEIRIEHRQKSISVELSFAMDFAFKHHVSAAHNRDEKCLQRGTDWGFK
jgi:hypothetical protein